MVKSFLLVSIVTSAPVSSSSLKLTFPSLIKRTYKSHKLSTTSPDTNDNYNDDSVISDDIETAPNSAHSSSTLSPLELVLTFMKKGFRSPRKLPTENQDNHSNDNNTNNNKDKATTISTIPSSSISTSIPFSCSPCSPCDSELDFTYFKGITYFKASNKANVREAEYTQVKEVSSDEVQEVKDSQAAITIFDVVEDIAEDIRTVQVNDIEVKEESNSVKIMMDQLEKSRIWDPRC